MARLAERLQVRPVEECGAVAVVSGDMVDLELGDDPRADGAGVRLFVDDLAAQAAPGGQVVPVSNGDVRPGALARQGMHGTASAGDDERHAERLSAEMRRAVWHRVSRAA